MLISWRFVLIATGMGELVLGHVYRAMRGVR